MGWILVRFQIVTGNFDPEVLQWPGGSLIASFLLALRSGTVALVGERRQLGRASRVYSLPDSCPSQATVKGQGTYQPIGIR